MTSENNSLVLIDAHAIIHRAYHAIQTDLLSPKGEPTKAVYGFTSTLLKVLKDVQPRYVVAAFDVGKSFRVEKFEGYKSTRPKLADDLAAQIGRVRDVVDAFGIPIFAVKGYEADDLLGALARQASENGIDSIIVTGDTDTFQLIGPHTRVDMFVRLGDPVIYDEAKIKERYDLAPEQLVDFKALRGDPSDNIPGVSGIGDKTATRLIQAYGSIEGLLEHIDEVEPKLRAKLKPAQEQLRRNKELVTIDQSAPVELDIDAARLNDYDHEKVLQLFRALGFQSLLPRLPEVPSGSEGEQGAKHEPETAKEDYHCVSTEAELDELAGRLLSSGGFVVDVETTSVDELSAELVGIALGVGDCESYYIPIGHRSAGAQEADVAPPNHTADEPQLALFASGSSSTATIAAEAKLQPNQLAQSKVAEKLGPIFANTRIPKFAHNAKYDLIILARAGLPIEGLAFDTLIAAHLLEQGGQKLGLKELVFSRFGFQMTEIEALIGKGKGQIPMSEVAIEQVSRYACSDADFTYRLMDIYRPQLEERGLEQLFYQVEIPLVPVIVDMECQGILLDVEALARLSEVITSRLASLKKEIYEHVGATFNLGSPAQLSDALFNKLGLPSARLERTRTGQISTTAKVLEALRPLHPVISLILEHRELSKLKGTYVDALPGLVNRRDGRLHTSYNQVGSVTGRISSSNPNLQNIPVKSDLGRLVRRAIIAPEGKILLSADYSQVELRILAHITQDPELLKAFADGEDIHASTAARLFNLPIDQVTSQQRRLGKTINFGVVYGISDWGIADRTELNLEESRKLISDYFEKYPRVKEYIDHTKEQARRDGYVESIMGRRRYFPELASDRRVPVGVRNQAEREAINMPVQASAADIIKLAMVNLHSELTEGKFKSRIILQVHDELVLECPSDEVEPVAVLVCEVMENAYQLSAPLKVDISVGANWDKMKPLEV